MSVRGDLVPVGGRGDARELSQHVVEVLVKLIMQGGAWDLLKRHSGIVWAPGRLAGLLFGRSVRRLKNPLSPTISEGASRRALPQPQTWAMPGAAHLTFPEPKPLRTLCHVLSADPYSFRRDRAAHASETRFWLPQCGRNRLMPETRRNPAPGATCHAHLTQGCLHQRTRRGTTSILE